MKKYLVLSIVLLGAVYVGAQGTSIVLRVPLLQQNGWYTFPRLGPTLSVTNGQLDAVLPGVPAVKIPHDREAVFDVNAEAVFTTQLLGDPMLASVQVWRNGLLQRLGADYTYDAATRVLTTKYAFSLSDSVVVRWRVLE